MSENDVDQELKGASRPRRSKPTRMRRFAVGITALLIVALTAGAAYVYSINRGVTQNITRSDSLPADNPADPGQSSRPTPSAQATGSLNYVLLGSDSRDAANSANGRSDSIMVVHLNAARDKAYIISFPRDMYVEIPGHGMNKINAAYSLGGAKLTVLTLEELLGVRMDHVALVDFEGFMELTDSLGGVTRQERARLQVARLRLP